MSVLALILILALLGLITWAVITYVPMPAGIRNLIVIVAVIAGVLYALSAFGIGLPHLQVPSVK
jgi:hypothetical protein